MNGKRRIRDRLGVLGLVLALGACQSPNNGPSDQGRPVNADEVFLAQVNPNSDLDKDGVANQIDADIDGDGLSNAAEALYGTSPYLTDTDGDGWSDQKETELYVAATNAFNPLCADLPRLQLIFKSEPQVTLQYTTSTGSAVEYSTTKTTGYSASHMASNSFTNTSASEQGWSVESETGLELGADPSFSQKFTVGGHGTYTQEDSHQWGVEDSRTNSVEASRAKSESQSTDLTKVGGRIRYAVAFRNVGPIAYRVQAMQLTAYRIDRAKPGMVTMVGDLTQESGALFSGFTLNPGDESGIFNYDNANLYVQDVLDLLANSSGLVCGIAGYNVSMEDKTFTLAATEAAAKTAKLFIDYGPGTELISEQYLVATKGSIDPAATTLAGLYRPTPLTDLLAKAGVPFTTEGNGTADGLASVRGLGASAAKRCHWYVRHEFTRNNQRYHKLYADSSLGVAYQASQVLVNTGDVVELIYSVDGDGDGLPRRLETLLGTSDSLVDSDGDTLGDAPEVNDLGTNPANPDTDGDGLRDDVDPKPLLVSYSSDPSLKALSVEGASLTVAFVPTTKAYALAAAVSGDTVHLKAEPTSGAYAVKVSVNGGAPQSVQADKASPVTGLVLGNNSLAVEVTAMDTSTKTTYTLALVSRLASVPNFRAESTKERSVSLGWDDPGDSRIQKFLVYRNPVPGPLQALTFGNVLYSLGKLSGDTYLVADPGAAESDYLDEAAELQQAAGYAYLIIPYAKVGTTHHYGDPLRATVATCTTMAPGSGRLFVDLYYLKGVANEDGGDWPTFYWTIHAQLDGVVYGLDGDKQVLPAGTDRSFFMFADRLRYGLDTGTRSALPKPNGWELNRAVNHKLRLTLSIREEDTIADDDVGGITYEFTYLSLTDEWTGTAIQQPLRKGGDRDWLWQARSNDGDVDVHLGLRWQ